MDITSWTSEEDIEMLFRHSKSNYDHAATLISKFLPAASENAPSDEGTESSFIAFWDRNIRTIMETLVPQGTTIQNSNRNTSTYTLRPDFSFLFGHVCLFRERRNQPLISTIPEPSFMTN
jgi:hypothetical protein